MLHASWAAIAAVGAATVTAVLLLPGLGTTGGGLSGLVGARNPAQLDAIDRFGLPLLSRTVMVQHDPGGLDVFTQADSVLRALETDERTLAAGG